MRPRPLLRIVSNGYGEDLIATEIARELRAARPGLRLCALPLVGQGERYRGAGIEVEGPVRSLPSHGMTMHGVEPFLADLRAGLAGLTFGQVAHLLRARSEALLVVGDIYAQALAGLARARTRYVFQPLVSAWSWRAADGPPQRLFMERITYPERALMRGLARRVYARDEATAVELRRRGVDRARFLGNPLVDAARGTPIPGLRHSDRPLVAVLPGTKDWVAQSLATWWETLQRLPEVDAVVAWAGNGGALPGAFAQAERRGEGWWCVARGAQRLHLVRGRFGDVLASADVAAGHAGTGHEQAVAMGLPVVTGPMAPAYRGPFVRNQQRLLGPALHVVEGDAGLRAEALRRALAPAAREAAREVGRTRLGPPGGARRIAADLLADADPQGAWRAAAQETLALHSE